MICSIQRFFICPDYALDITRTNMVKEAGQAGGLGGEPKGASDAFAIVSNSLPLVVKSACTNFFPAEKGPSGR